jgi:hypothetical protein
MFTNVVMYIVSQPGLIQTIQHSVYSYHSQQKKQMYLEDDSVDATIIPKILLVEVGMALHLDHARLVLVPTVPKNKQI